MHEILSLAKYLASSRSGFSLLEMDHYLSKKYTEKELYYLLKPHFYDLGLFCSSDYKCTKIKKEILPANDIVLKELEIHLKSPGLPVQIEKMIESFIEKSIGKNWEKGEKAALIRENIVKQKEEFWKGKGEYRYPWIRVISYLLYHFPVYFCQYQYLLLELLKGGLLTNKMRILDVGSGPGTITLSTLDFLTRLNDIYSRNNIDIKLNIRFSSIEQEQENINCYKELTSDLPECSRTNITIDEPVNSPIETAPIIKEVDLLVFSNILAESKNEPVKRADTVERIASASKDPCIIIIEPADLENSKALRITQQALVKKGFNIYSPCSFIWGKQCSGLNCWSFREQGNIRVPGFMRKIAGTVDSYRYLNMDMKFSYVICRKDGVTKHTYGGKGKFMALSNLKKHAGKRINIAVSVMSGNLGDEKTFVFKICDGTAIAPCYAVMPSYHINENNRGLIDAGYGDIVEICGTVIRENSEQHSCNAFVNRNTTIVIVD